MNHAQPITRPKPTRSPSERTRVFLSPSDTLLVGKYAHEHKHVHVVCDSTDAAFEVVLPDLHSCEGQEIVVYNAPNSGAGNIVTVTGELMEGGVTSHTLNPGDTVTFVSDLKTRWLLGDVNASRGICISVVDSTTAVTVGNGAVAFTVPAFLNGYNLTAVIASVHDKGVTGTTDIQLRRRRAGVDVDMLSTKITIGDEFFAADGVVDTDNDDLATGDQIYFDVDAIHSGTAPNGLSVTPTFGS